MQNEWQDHPSMQRRSFCVVGKRGGHSDSEIADKLAWRETERLQEGNCEDNEFDKGNVKPNIDIPKSDDSFLTHLCWLSFSNIDYCHHNCRKRQKII